MEFLSLTFSPDGSRAAASAQTPRRHEHGLIVFDIPSGKSLFSTEGESLAYSPDGRWLAAVAADIKTVLLLDARTHETTARFSGHERVVFKAAFSPDSRYLASCSQDRTVRVWETDGGACQVPPFLVMAFRANLRKPFSWHASMIWLSR